MSEYGNCLLQGRLHGPPSLTPAFPAPIRCRLPLVTVCRVYIFYVYPLLPGLPPVSCISFPAPSPPSPSPPTSPLRPPRRHCPPRRRHPLLLLPLLPPPCAAIHPASQPICCTHPPVHPQPAPTHLPTAPLPLPTWHHVACCLCSRAAAGAPVKAVAYTHCLPPAAAAHLVGVLPTL